MEIKRHPVYTSYGATDSGDVWSFKRNQFMKGHKNPSGYWIVKLDGKSIAKHRVIYESIHGLVVDSSHLQIDHIDSNIDNNAISNLQTLTKAAHARKTHKGRDMSMDASRGKEITRYRLDDDGCRVDVATYKSIADAANAVNCSRMSLYYATRQNKPIRGYIWEFVAQPDMDDEVWCTLLHKPFKGVCVSNKGRIITASGLKTYGHKTRGGYCMTTIKGTLTSIHTVICLAFNGEPPSSKHSTVDHIDKVRHNNSSENLRWATVQMQIDHSHSQSVAAYDKDTGEEMGRWKSARAAARELKYSNSTGISQCINGRINTYKKMVWRKM